MRKIYFWTIATIVVVLMLSLTLKYVSDYRAHKRSEAFFIENTRRMPAAGADAATTEQGQGKDFSPAAPANRGR